MSGFRVLGSRVLELHGLGLRVSFMSHGVNFIACGETTTRPNQQIRCRELAFFGFRVRGAVLFWVFPCLADELLNPKP